MYEEDRQLALAMYNRLFDECANEQGLIQMLASPTRQAVLVARAYDAKERKLQVSSQTREGNGESSSVPAFVNVIDKLFVSAEEKGLFKTAPEAAEEKSAAAEIKDQLSFFDFDDTAEQPETKEHPEQIVPEEETESSVTTASAETADGAEASADETVGSDLAAETGNTEKFAAIPAEEVAPASEDEVDAFINDFSLEDGIEEPQSAAEMPVYAVAEEGEKAFAKKRKVKKVMAGWLFLFVIFAIPIGIAGVLVLCVPTILSLLLSGGLAGLGVLAVNSVISSGFVLLPDILVVLGLALIIFALGLLFLWLFVWFIGGAMVGLVQGLINLGNKWCYKEVAVNE